MHLKVGGLKAHATVTIGTRAVDAHARPWHAEATFDADGNGVVDLDQAHNRYPHQALVYQQAGYGIGGAPYALRGTSIMHPVIHRALPLGGTRPANDAALLPGWSKVLDLLKSL